MRSKRGLTIALAILLLVILLGGWAATQHRLPAPTGPHAVGRTTRQWVDTSRRDALDPAGQPRETPLVIWYPAQDGTGSAMPYFPGLATVAADLAASGEVSAPEAFALRFVGSDERLDAAMSDAASQYPVILLSPGNGTNVEFYDAYAADLASHGYVVVGVNHPYDVAAVALSDGRVARFVEGPLELSQREAWTVGRIAERTADLLFVLDELRGSTGQGDDLLSGRMDLSRVGALGHSPGGITAAQTCRADDGLGACLNLDGLLRGGPFAAEANPTPPDQPFMLITKEVDLHPALAALFAAVPSGSYRVVVPEATHESFSDAPLLLPGPLSSGARPVAAAVRSYTQAFFDQTLRGQAGDLLQQGSAGNVQVEVYAPS